MEDRAEVRESYDRIADEYARHVAGELEHKPLDRALLDDFAREVAGAGPVVEVGCGPGHVAAYLHGRGADARGIDLSPAMVERARTLFPAVSFAVGDVTALAAEDGAWAGAVAFYSLIHLPRDEVPAALRELRRVLRPGAPLLVAFHTGDHVLHLDELWGTPVRLDFFFFTPDEMEGYLRAAGFEVEARHERAPYPDVEAQTHRCYLRARRAP